jgi:hypothetical protein
LWGGRPSVITIDSSDEEMDDAFWMKISQSFDEEVMDDAFRDSHYVTYQHCRHFPGGTLQFVPLILVLYRHFD